MKRAAAVGRRTMSTFKRNASKRTLLVFVVVAGLLVTGVALGAQRQAPPRANAPWYPSLQAFEHYDSGRSHVFPKARFGGSFTGPNVVKLFPSRPGAYPSGYNMSYLNANAAFIQGGSYGNVKNSIGPFVAKVNPKTLKPVWYTQLVNTVETGEWDYPGAMAIMSDGYIYVVSGYRVFKVDPANGNVVKTLKLPTKVYMQNNYPDTPPTYASTLTENAINTSYNGLNALPDGTIVVKSLYRVAGCTKPGPTALLDCANARNVPASNLISVNPKTMKIIDKITLPAFAGARPTITRYHGVDYVYLLEKTSNAVRYSVRKGVFKLDTRWTPAAVPYPNQTTGGSLIIMNDWVLGATNSIPAAGALTVFAINQSDASKIFRLQPYLNDPIPPEISKLFATAASGGAGGQLGRDVVGGRYRKRPLLRGRDAGTQGRGIQAHRHRHQDCVEEEADHHGVGHPHRPEGSARLGRHGHSRSRDPRPEQDRQGRLPRRGHRSRARTLGESPLYDSGKRDSAQLRRERVLPGRKGHLGQGDAVP